MVFECARSALLFGLGGVVAVGVAGGLEIGLGVVLEESLRVVEEVQAKLLVVDDGSDLTEFQRVYLHSKNIIFEPHHPKPLLRLGGGRSKVRPLRKYNFVRHVL
jgi:hypothetical protein